MDQSNDDPPPPPGWGTDGLTQYIDGMRANQFATYVHKTEAVDRLTAIDRCFVTLAAGWTNPSSLVSANLLLRSHAAFRGCVAAAMAGQTAEAYPLARSALEYAAYALHIHEQPGLAEVW